MGKVIKEKKPDLGPLALYFKHDGNRQNLFVWLNFLWGGGADVFDDNFCPIWTSEAALQATRDYIALHTEHQITSKGSETFVEQDARQSFQQGNSAMMPVWWWAYSPMTNPDQSVLGKDQVAFTGMPAYQGDSPVTYAISMPFSISQHSQHQEAAWEFLKWLSNPDLDKLNALHQPFQGDDGEQHTIINNVVTHTGQSERPGRQRGQQRHPTRRSRQSGALRHHAADCRMVGDRRYAGGGDRGSGHRWRRGSTDERRGGKGRAGAEARRVLSLND